MKKSLLSHWILCAGLAAVLFSPRGFAQDEKHEHKHVGICENDLLLPLPEGEVDRSPQQIIPSGRDADVIEDIKKANLIINGPNGIAKLLGLTRPPHQLDFVPSGQLNMLASVGRHPVGHAHDGSILATDGQRSGVLEFVTGGCPTCRSFYSDTTSFVHQIEVIAHVAGHNHVSANSRFSTIRNTDAIAESLALYKLMEDLKSNYDHDEVAQWYQYLLTLVESQDLARSTFDEPESFRINPEDLKNPKRIIHANSDPNQNIYPNARHPKSPTPNILQATIVNLPQDTPQWKKDMAYHMERMQRVYGFYMSQKILNEGFATLMMEIIPAYYTPWTSSYHNIEFADLLNGVANRVDFGNPYWLGREAWRRVRARFNDRPEIKGLEPLERDRKFIEYATREIISQLDDYSFLRMALDDKWVTKFNLSLSRPVKPEETDYSIPRTKPDDEEQKIVVSNDPKRIINYIVRKVADHRYHMPTVMLEDLNAFGRGVVALRHDMLDGIPLNKPLAAQTLYVHSQMHKRPVSLVTVNTYEYQPPRDSDLNGWGWWTPPPAPQIKSNQIRIEVEPSGKVSVFDRNPKAVFIGPQGSLPDDGEGKYDEVLNQELTAKLQDAVNEYINDMSIGSGPDLVEWDQTKFLPQIETAVESSIKGAGSLISHAPTAAAAILEYSKALEARMALKIRQAVEGKIKFLKTKKGVRLRVMPIIPKFQYDFKMMEKMRKSKPPIEPDPGMGMEVMLQQFFSPLPQMMAHDPADDDGLDAQGDGRKPRDKFWGPKPKEGDGDGEGDEDGEEGDKPDKGIKPGQGDLLPGEVDIPLEVFAEFLNEQVQLPNLKPKAGQTERKDRVREGATRRPNGNYLYDRWVSQAMALGQQYYLKKKRVPNINAIPKNVIARQGFKMLQPSDFIVSDHEDVPDPDINAIVVVDMDMTGSMSGDPIAAAKKFMFNLKTLLSRKYKKIEWRYVGFSGSAHEFPEDKFWKAFIGGGTDYSSGFVKSTEILKEYPPAKWDRYSVIIGDAEDATNPNTLVTLEDMYKETEFTAFVQTAGYGGGPASDTELSRHVKGLASSEEYFGYTVLGFQPGDDIKAVKGVFGQDKGK